MRCDSYGKKRLVAPLQQVKSYTEDLLKTVQELHDQLRAVRKTATAVPNIQDSVRRATPLPQPFAFARMLARAQSYRPRFRLRSHARNPIRFAVVRLLSHLLSRPP